ncbi:MAG: twin-arginine translocation signal domain-containing protein, partial [Candidatus Hydrogenedentes bacterium]|nr:twin-arginine translocation signal domain-containing protein [Candidatus Hydrogenedentota bacterium]
MLPTPSRRSFLKTTAAAGIALARGAQAADRPADPGTLTLNDDGNVFLYMDDDLNAADLRRYFESYCRPGVSTVAFCVGDMSWPTLYPTKVGVHVGAMDAGGDLKRVRMRRNVDNFSAEPGGFIGTALRTLRELGKTTLASFRMNDAHFTAPDNPNVSEFWKQHATLALGPAYGYYGGCLDYATDGVRDHFYQRVTEFMDLYPDVDGLELDAMRSPYFFAPDKGKEFAPLFTDLVKRIKTALADRAQKLNRPDYLLTINVPVTPELCLESGLDVAAWDAERLFDAVSVGTYQAYMNADYAPWRKLLVNGTRLFAYINCSPQTGQYLGLDEYRAAAANAFGGGADGIYLFNYPCLFELAMQSPTDAASVS